MQRILEKKTVTRISFWFCGFIYCNLPLAVAGKFFFFFLFFCIFFSLFSFSFLGMTIVLLHDLPCHFLINGWVLTQALYTLLFPFFTLPFFIKPNKRTKAYFLFISVLFLIFQISWMVFGSVLLAWSWGRDCRAANLPTWIMMLIMNILGYLGLLQSIGIIFDAASVELDTIEYSELGPSRYTNDDF